MQVTKRIAEDVVHLVARTKLSDCHLCSMPMRSLNISSRLEGRKARNPFDKRFPVNPKDLAANKEGGSHDLSKKIGERYDMPPAPGWTDKIGSFHLVPEMVPEFIIPDLTNFKLKPYVSYKVPKVAQSELTTKDLFNACYAEPAVKEFRKGKVDIEQTIGAVKSTS